MAVNTTGNGIDPRCIAEDYDDPDVTGMLVVLSFILSAAITILSTAYTYVSRSLPKEAYNSVDELVLCRIFGRKQIGDHDDIAEDARRRRLSRLESLILAMSDQHLVTGGAMLIVTWTIILGAGDVRKERSVYSLQVAIALANISSSIHLASLSILRFYLKDHKVQYTARVITMHVMLLLLCAGWIFGTAISDGQNHAITIDCAMSQLFSSGDLRRQGIEITCKIILMIIYWRCFYRNAKIIYGYPSIDQIIWSRLVHGVVATEHHNQLYTLKQRLEHRGKYMHLVKLSKLKHLTAWAFLYTWQELHKSFFLEMSWLIAFSTYGFITLGYAWSYREIPSYYFQPNYGQLMSILLLFISMLSVWDTRLDLHSHSNSDSETPDLHIDHDHNMGNPELVSLSTELRKHYPLVLSIEQMEAIGETTSMLAATTHLQGVPPLNKILWVLLYAVLQSYVALSNPLLSTESWFQMMYAFALGAFILIPFTWTIFNSFIALGRDLLELNYSVAEQTGQNVEFHSLLRHDLVARLILRWVLWLPDEMKVALKAETKSRSNIDVELRHV